MLDTNAKLAVIFHQMAQVMEILGEDRFRINAYAKAVGVMESLTLDLAQVGPDAKKLTAIEGIGKGLADKIAQYLQTGTIREHRELLAQVPPGLPALLGISGLGPKTVALLWRQGGVESLVDLRKKLEGNALAELPGMGPKKLENLRKSVAIVEQMGQRTRIGVALPLARWFVHQLRQMPGVKKAEYAGSLRRGQETIGDLDLLVAADEADAAGISDAFIKLEPVREVIAHGKTKTSVRLEDNLQADLRIVSGDCYGAALMYFTGSKEHNVAMRQRAIARGLSLNEYALTTKDDGQRVAGTTEDDVFRALGLAWIPPELRENRGELALAEQNSLPRLIERDDIKAELHAHSIASDGVWTIEELARAAIERGFHTVAITDHSKGQVQAHGLSDQRLEQHILAVRAIARQFQGQIRILAGSEVDIHTDGTLDYPDSLLKELDIVVASPHSALTQEPAKATSRFLKAMENPYVTIMGHLTGRLIGRREGLSPDLPALLKAAAQRGVAMEINANHMRLDLRDIHARAAIEHGVKLSINTDAHGPGDLDELTYGVLTARRAGATKEDVVNCMDQASLAKWIASTRA
ncbi:MAG: DNA polymerase/3'-5' exonuclease PolX [Phycisphaeraceae bacterium]|nr:DNA polymerase/3'-5' exonuclease PolX [Phycisphaeraceae bacterium]